MSSYSDRSSSPDSDVNFPQSRTRSSHRVADDNSPSPHSPTPSNTRGSPTPSSTATSTPAIKKRHVCPTCQKSFTTSGHLSRHARVHTGERNHKCPFPGCETRCSRQDNLQQHYRIHLSPGSRRSSSSSTRSALARALGVEGNGVRKRGSKYAVFTPPPAPESPPSTPPPLEQAYSLMSSLDSPPPLASAHPPLPVPIPPIHEYHSDGSSPSPDSRFDSGSPLIPTHSGIERRPSTFTGSFTPVTESSFEHASSEYSYYPDPHTAGHSYNGYQNHSLSSAPLSVPSQRGSISSVHSGSDHEHAMLNSTSSYVPSQHFSHHTSYGQSHTPSETPSPVLSHSHSYPYASTQSSADYSIHGAVDHSPIMNTRGVVYGSSHHSRVGYSTGVRYTSPVPGVSHLHGHYQSIATSEMV